MTFKEFLQDRWVFLLGQTIFLLFAGVLLRLLRVSGFALGFLAFLYLALMLVTLGVEFYRKKTFFDQMFQLLDQLEEKYYLSEIIESPNFVEGQKLTQLFRVVSKSMNDTIADYRRRNEDYSRYIETWVHEVKTPIASCKLIIENHSDPVTRSLEEEVDRIDQYVEQALYYTRSTVVEKDYVIRRCSLDQIVSRQVIKPPRRHADFAVQLEILTHRHTMSFRLTLSSPIVTHGQTPQPAASAPRLFTESGRTERRMHLRQRSDQRPRFASDLEVAALPVTTLTVPTNRTSQSRQTAP